MRNIIKQSKTSTVLEKIRMDLITGYYSPGQKLQMQQLKERYKVGYSPLREALSRLVSQGLVHLEDLCGFSVSNLSLKELYDLYSVRILIETKALELSIQHGDEHWEAEVIACWYRYAKYLNLNTNQPINQFEWNELQKEFTFTLSKACQSPWLLKIQDMLFDHASRYRFLCLGKHFQDKKIIDGFRQECEELVSAVLARDKAKALKISQEGWENSLEIMASIIKSTGIGTLKND
ncbi:TPA: GntR family transcriptional regulator [Legionella pneumophila]|nr:GntR family transcriptional regulator [Legionella pneumophila]